MVLETFLIFSLRMADIMGSVAKVNAIHQECRERDHTELYCIWEFNFNHWPDYPFYPSFYEYIEFLPDEEQKKELKLNRY